MENRFISTHRMDGYLLIAEGLRGRGYDRTPEAVKKHAKRALGIALPKYPYKSYRKCIACGCWDARPNTQAGKAGFCPTCWTKRKAQAMREGRAEKDAEAEYQREKKQRRSRERLRGKQL